MEEKKKIVKKYFDIQVDVSVPGKLTYRVLAETPEDAIKMIDKTPIKQFTPNLLQHKKLKVVVKDAGTLNIKLTKNYRG